MLVGKMKLTSMRKRQVTTNCQVIAAAEGMTMDIDDCRVIFLEQKSLTHSGPTGATRLRQFLASWAPVCASTAVPMSMSNTTRVQLARYDSGRIENLIHGKNSRYTYHATMPIFDTVRIWRDKVRMLGRICHLYCALKSLKPLFKKVT